MNYLELHPKKLFEDKFDLFSIQKLFDNNFDRLLLEKALERQFSLIFNQKKLLNAIFDRFSSGKALKTIFYRLLIRNSSLKTILWITISIFIIDLVEVLFDNRCKLLVIGVTGLSGTKL